MTFWKSHQNGIKIKSHHYNVRYVEASYEKAGQAFKKLKTVNGSKLKAATAQVDGIVEAIVVGPLTCSQPSLSHLAAAERIPW